MRESSYVLITAARNEASYIGHTLDSVLAQTVLPKRWVIVSDGSTDETDEIVKKRTDGLDFVVFIRLRRERNEHEFGSKVYALRAAFEQLKDVDYEFIGNLDADISFENTYFEELIRRMHIQPQLGIAGGFIYEQSSGAFKSRPCNEIGYVSGAVQMFRRDCYVSLGGYTPLKYGGEDTFVLFMAVLKGWTVHCYPDLAARHHKVLTDFRGAIRRAFQSGASDFQLGTDLRFASIKSIRRIVEKPYCFHGVAHLLGFIWAALTLPDRGVPDHFSEFYRHRQWSKFRDLLHFRLRKAG